MKKNKKESEEAAGIRRRAEEALRESEERYRNLFENAQIGIYRTTPEGSILMANPALIQMLGYSSFEELALRNLEREGFEPSYPRSQFKELMESQSEVIGLEAAWTRKDGSVVFVRENAKAIRDERGAVLYYEGMVEDISKRKRVEEALKESEDKYKTLVEQSLQGIVVIQDFQIVFANDAFAQISGYKVNELLSLPPEKVKAMIHPDDQALVWGRFRDRLAGKSIPSRYEYRGIRKDGSVSWLEMFASRVNYGGKPAIQGSIVDLTERKQAEEALKESEERFRRALENIPDVVVIYDSDLRIRYINAATRRITGRPTSDFIGKREEDIWPPEVYQVYLPTLREAFNTREISSLESDLSLPGTGFRNLIITCVPLIDEKGKVREVLGITHDLTEGKRAEELLRTSEAQLSNAMKIAKLGYWEYDVADDLFTFNDHFYAIFRTTAKKVGGYKMSPARYAQTFLHPDDMSVIANEMKKALETTDPNFSRQLEHRIIYADGEIGYISVRYFIIKDNQGRTIKTYGANQDITERKRAEDTLVRLSNAVKMSTDSIVISDLEGRIIDVNDATLTMYGTKDKNNLVGKNSIDMIAAEDRERAFADVKEMLDKGYIRSQEYHIVTKDGRRLPVEMSSGVMKDADGAPVGFVGITRDISERTKLRQQLIQSEKLAAVGTLAYGIAHEFNNVLAGMTVAAEFGLSQSDNQEVRESFQAIAENSQRGSSITNSLLAVAGEKREKKELTDITQPLENVLSFSRRELEKANINIMQDFEPIPQIFCDPGELSEVFLNMVNNARDAMTPRGGTLSVKVRPDKDNIQIVFKDTGEGIPEEIKDKIFDPFVTTKGALGKSEVPGTGLGLYVTYGIINSYHGKIDVDSRVGKGTTFTILIPISKNLPPESVLKKKVEFPKEIKKKLNILLVDDEEVICSTLKRFLESKGHQVTTSLKAEEGFGLFKKDKFDVVLSDITMPGMDGIELIRDMKEKDSNARIIAITGHVRQQKLEEAKNAGAEEVLIKPFRSAALYETIARLLSEKRREDDSAKET